MIRYVCLVLFILLWPGLVQAADIGAVGAVERRPDGVSLHCTNGVLTLRVLAPDLVRVRAARTAAELQADHSWALVDHPWPTPAWTLRQSTSELAVETTELKVVVDVATARVRFVDAHSGRIISRDGQPVSFDATGPGLSLSRVVGTDEHFYGMGEKTAHLDKRRGHYTMWTSDTPNWTEGTDPLYQSIPFYIGLEHGAAYGMFFDNSYKSAFDFASENPQYAIYSVVAGPLDYYFMYGPSMRKVLERYTDLTGRMPLPPKWALGNQQSRYSYYPASQVRDIVQRYRHDHLPLDVVHLDIHYMNQYRIFTWDPVGFPDPTKLISDLLKQGVHVVTIIDPGIKYQPSDAPVQPSSDTGPQTPHYSVYDEGARQDFYVKRQDGRVYVGKVWPGDAVFVDYTIEAARRWWGDLHKALLDHGVAGVWNDMNEPSDFTPDAEKAAADVVFDDLGTHSSVAKNRNVFALLEARATFEGMQRLRPRQRPFIITRAGYAGIQRYATMWTGDIPSSWDALSLSLPMFESLGLSGEPFVGNDIGGFMGRSNGELLARWYQVGFLTPLCRNHHVLDEYDQEPWRFGPPYEDIIRKYLRLRYRLMPYLYTVLAEAHRTGMPWFRPLVLNYQNDPNTYNMDDEFMLGDALLAAPVTAPHQREREVYLPAGLWYDFWTEKPIQGGRTLTVPAPLDRLPLYVRGGSIIPFGPAMDYVGQIPNPSVEFVVYPNQDGQAIGAYYGDDGVSPDYERGVYSLFRLLATRRLLKGGSSEQTTVQCLSNGPDDQIVTNWRWAGRRAEKEGPPGTYYHRTPH